MAYKAVERNTVDIKKSVAGTSWEGVFVGSKPIKTELGDTVIWLFKDDEDKPFGIFGFTNLNFQMENVKEGSQCRITYKGQSKVKNKYGKFPHQALVEVDDVDLVDSASGDMACDDGGKIPF